MSDWLDELMGTEEHGKKVTAPIGFLGMDAPGQDAHGPKVYTYMGRHWQDGDEATEEVYTALAIRHRQLHPGTPIKPFLEALADKQEAPSEPLPPTQLSAEEVPTRSARSRRRKPEPETEPEPDNDEEEEEEE